jgi:hypothetical protein
MSTLRQQIAARQNGARSNGPITPDGKNRSSANSTSHGLTGRSNRTLVLANESPDQFHAFKQRYHDQFAPVGQAEVDLVDEMLAAKWRQRRAWAIETALIDVEMDLQASAIAERFSRIDEPIRTALATKELTDNGKALATIQRHEAALGRAYHRALTLLLKLQEARRAAEAALAPKPAHKPAPAPTPNPNKTQPPNPKIHILQNEPDLHVPNHPKKPETASGNQPEHRSPSDPPSGN